MSNTWRYPFSLMENNTTAEELNLFIISNGISPESKNKVERLAKDFQRTVYWIDFAPYRDQLLLDMEWPISISSYARLFMAQMLPSWCQRGIYLDCDTIVCGSLLPLWDTDMNEKAVAGVADLIMPDFKKKIGLHSEDTYVNAGILLVDLEHWRQYNLQNRFIAYIDAHKGRVTHHDQGVINGVLRNEIHILHPRYNAMTPFFTTRYRRLVRFFRLKDYYSQEELSCAISTPAIVHFTPEYVGRVWEKGCRHPQAQRYLDYLTRTEWAHELPNPKPLPAKLRVLNWMCRHMPVVLLRPILK